MSSFQQMDQKKFRYMSSTPEQLIYPSKTRSRLVIYKYHLELDNQVVQIAIQIAQ